jgi:hypothetical protein
MSALCQKRTFWHGQTTPLFDHLVGGNEQVCRYIKAKCLGSLEIDTSRDRSYSNSSTTACYYSKTNA